MRSHELDVSLHANAYRPLLAHDKPHVRDFAAESFAYLLDCLVDLHIARRAVLPQHHPQHPKLVRGGHDAFGFRPGIDANLGLGIDLATTNKGTHIERPTASTEAWPDDSVCCGGRRK